MSKKINIVTLGCSKNLVDSEVLMTQLKANNFDIVTDSNDLEAKVVIINTCGFIQDAKQESINTIMQFIKAKQNKQIEQLHVIGCLSERYKNVLEKEIPEVDTYFGVNDLHDILKKLNAKYRHELIGERSISTPSHYAYLKVSEGCGRSCAFCAIPIIRGGHVSVPIEILIKQASYLVKNGVKEIILIAQDLSYYGYDLYKEFKLSELLDRLSDIEGLEWIRLQYAYPQWFPKDTISVMKQKPNICRYIDIPFQHISDNILKQMRRGHDQKTVQDLLSLFRNEIPGIAVRTTFLVGFPNETRKEFEELKQFVTESKFERLGVFAYSHEEGTYSFNNFKDNVPEKVKNERMNEIMEVQRQVSKGLNQKKIGGKYKVLIDRREGDYYIGRTEFDSPEVDNEVLIPYDPAIDIGKFYITSIESAEDYDLFGNIAL